MCLYKTPRQNPWSHLFSQLERRQLRYQIRYVGPVVLVRKTVPEFSSAQPQFFVSSINLCPFERLKKMNYPDKNFFVMHRPIIIPIFPIQKELITTRSNAKFPIHRHTYFLHFDAFYNYFKTLLFISTGFVVNPL